MSIADPARPSFGDVDLQRRIMELRRPDNVTNLICLAREYACLTLAIAGADSQFLNGGRPATIPIIASA